MEDAPGLTPAHVEPAIITQPEITGFVEPYLIEGGKRLSEHGILEHRIDRGLIGCAGRLAFRSLPVGDDVRLQHPVALAVEADDAEGAAAGRDFPRLVAIGTSVPDRGIRRDVLRVRGEDVDALLA